MLRRLFINATVTASFALLLPAAASAQSRITGLVKDATGVDSPSLETANLMLAKAFESDIPSRMGPPCVGLIEMAPSIPLPESDASMLRVCVR